MKSTPMRGVATILFAIVLAIPLTWSARAQDQTEETGRIEGRAKDGAGAVLPGVDVTLRGVETIERHVMTDGNGRFVFDGVQPGAHYVIAGALAGFRSDSGRDVAVAGGQTRTIDLEMEVGCVDEQGISLPDLDELLTTAAIAHVRVSDVVEDENDGCGLTYEAVVLSAVRFTTAGQRIGPTFRLLGAGRFERGNEYLLFLSPPYGKKHPRVGASFERPVIGGRLRGASVVDMEIRSGMPIGDALTRLREVRERYSRYRRYGTSPEPAPLETLRYRTGWIMAGWTSGGSGVQPAFEWVDNVRRPRGLPHPDDRIRMTMDATIYILEFGAKGEERRRLRPTIRHSSISDETGKYAQAGVVYRVADVRLESIPDEGREYAWIRIVAR